MEWLKQWVRELVMLVLLAGCLEMLVPLGGLKKYVRMVMGLLVVVTVLNPILSLWGAEVNLDEASLLGATDRLPTMAQVRADAERYAARSQGLAAAQLRRQVESRAAAVAREVEGVAGASAAAEVTKGTVSEPPRITRVHVYIDLGEPQGALVKPVEPVRIGQAAPPPQPAAAAQSPAADAVRRKVAEGLGVEPAQVMVTIKEGS